MKRQSPVPKRLIDEYQPSSEAKKEKKRSNDNKLYEVEIVEVDKEKKKVKIHFKGYSHNTDEFERLENSNSTFPITQMVCRRPPQTPGTNVSICLRRDADRSPIMAPIVSQTDRRPLKPGSHMRRLTCDIAAGNAWDIVPTCENIRRRHQEPASQVFTAGTPAKLT